MIVGEFEINISGREILIVCNQLQANYDPHKVEWTIDELYETIFGEKGIHDIHTIVTCKAV